MEWEVRQEKSFEMLKKQFTIESVLVVPDLDKKMRMEIDALDFATRGVLSMKCEDGQCVRIEDEGLGFHFIFFHFPFIFSYFLLKRKKTKCDIITGHMTWSQKSHTHMI